MNSTDTGQGFGTTPHRGPTYEALMLTCPQSLCVNPREVQNWGSALESALAHAEKQKQILEFNLNKTNIEIEMIKRQMQTQHNLQTTHSVRAKQAPPIQIVQHKPGREIGPPRGLPFIVHSSDSKRKRVETVKKVQQPQVIHHYAPQVIYPFNQYQYPVIQQAQPLQYNIMEPVTFSPNCYVPPKKASPMDTN